jgi:hypothetical protein
MILFRRILSRIGISHRGYESGLLVLPRRRLISWSKNIYPAIFLFMFHSCICCIYAREVWIFKWFQRGLAFLLIFRTDFWFWRKSFGRCIISMVWLIQFGQMIRMIGFFGSVLFHCDDVSLHHTLYHDKFTWGFFFRFLFRREFIEYLGATWRQLISSTD